MPKERSTCLSITYRSSASPYPCIGHGAKGDELGNPIITVENMKEWDDARCPICMEHPHNAVLLICSSQEKGCRPYMCNTSHRHSNCLDQFCKSPVPSPSVIQLQQVPVSSSSSNLASQSAMSQETRVEQLVSNIATPCDDDNPVPNSTLFCPFCRGHIYGWSVIELARHYMNSLPRSCSLETCKFTGTYLELRKHARTEHPYTRPSEVDPSRQHEWTMFERERELEDFRSTLQSAMGINESAEDEGLDEPSVLEIDISQNGVPFMLTYLSSVLSLTEMILGTVGDYSNRSDARGSQRVPFRRPVRGRPFGRYRDGNDNTYGWRSDEPGRRRFAQRLRWRDQRWAGNSNRR